MYKNFYLMQKEPFDSHPSPEIFYKSNAHQNGWNYLLQGIKNSEPILLVAGDYGAGKTLLYLKLIKLFKKNVHLPSVYVPTPTYSFIMVLEKIMVELGISIDEIDPADESRLQQTIHEYFEKRTSGKKKTIHVVIDDAQEFSYSFVNKLRLFASYNCSGYFPIKIILFTHPYLLKMLNYKKMTAFGQRIKRIYSLRPLNFEETREYIYFRLIHSGAKGSPVFEDEAIRFIKTISKGNPRLINNICDNCLLVAGSKKSNLITQSLVNEAVAIGNLMGLEEIQKPQGTSSSSHDKPGQIPAAPPQANHAYGKRDEETAPQGYNAPMEHNAPAGYNYTQRDETGAKQEIHNKSSRNEDVYSQADQTGRSENYRSEKKEKSRSNIKKFGSRYGKTGIIIILILIILFLFFYLLNQNKSNEMHNLQGSSGQVMESTPKHIYTVENSDMFKGSEVLKKDLNLDAVTRKDKLLIKGKYHPIIFMENLL